eukprot:6784975-Pyramimonas_sp.AAC.1
MCIRDRQSEKGGGPDPMLQKMGRGKGTLKEELEFWESVAKGGYRVTTDGKKSASIASKWQRALRDQPSLAERYSQ